MSERFQSRYPDPTLSPGLALWHVTNAWQRMIRAALSPHGLTHTQFVLLATLTATDPDHLVTQRVLAKTASTDEMMTSNIIRALEKKSLLIRTPHPTDGRAVLLSPTTAGIELVRAANRDVEAADESYFATLSEPMRARLLEALQTLHAGDPRCDADLPTQAINRHQ